MACTSFPKLSLPMLQVRIPTIHHSKLPQFIPKSSDAQIFGLKLQFSNSSTLVVVSPKSTVSAKTSWSDCFWATLHKQGLEQGDVEYIGTLRYYKGNLESLPNIQEILVSKGDVPPNFSLKDQDGKVVSLSKFKGKPAVVYFYPADDSPGCTKEACAFRDSYEKFKKAGAEVVGISGDDPVSHKAFAQKYRLPFTLLSDDGNKVRKEWGVPSDLFGTLAGRQTYVLDKKGVVQLIYNNQFQPEKHVDETLKLLQSL